MTTVALADWVSNLTYSNLPQPVIDAAVRSFQNGLGCVIGGSNNTATRRALTAVLPLSDTKLCTLLGQSTSHIDLQSAALINGIASHVDDYDDTHLATVIHPAGVIIVSLFAFVEYMCRNSQYKQAISGQAFITALVAGIETSLRVGLAVSPNHYDAGWHITGTVSSMGVAAAISNLLRLDSAVVDNALGIAATQVTGIRVHFGTDTKSFHVGRAAQNGIMAVLLAESGFTAAPDALEGRRGWVEVVGNGANTLSDQIRAMQVQVMANTSQTSERPIWEIENNTFKPFPCGIVIHPTIDGSIQLHKELNFSTSNSTTEIERVDLQVNPLVLDLTGIKTPKDGLEAKFSVYHGCAIGLIFGSAKPAQYESSVVNQEDVAMLRSKVVAVVDKQIRSDEAIVKLTMKDGSTFTKHVEHAIGSLDNPMTNAELVEKFVNQAEPILGKTAATQLNEIAWKVADLEDIRDIIRAAE